MDFQSHKYTDRYHHHNYYYIFLSLCLFQDLLSSSSCNTDMARLTILTNPAAIRPEKKKRKQLSYVLTPFCQLMSHPFFAHPPSWFFHSPFPHPCFYNAHYHFFHISIHPFQCFYLSFAHTIVYPPVSNSLCLNYQSSALTFSLLLCFSISTSPWALSGPRTPMS